MFSFNNPFGACPRCAGIGSEHKLSEAKLIPNPGLSLRQGGIAVNGFKTMEENGWVGPLFAAVGEKYGFTLDTPLKEYTPKALDALLHGTRGEKYHIFRRYEDKVKEEITDFEGVVPAILRRAKMFGDDYYGDFWEDAPCPECGGARLSKIVLAVTVGGLSIDEVCHLSIDKMAEFTDNLVLSETEEKIAGEILKEIKKRLQFLISVGLHYLTLSRQAGSLSGGEAQRIRLATQIGSALVGVMYILDEPSIGLHQRDNGKLIATLKKLRDLGNTVIVVEHDAETMENADYLVDVGPGAGIHGGRIVACGTPEEVSRNRASLTGDYLSGRKKIAVPSGRRPGNGHFLTVEGAKENNLKNVTVRFPLGAFVCVTGVSGSGKSSLVNACLLRTLEKELNGALTRPGKCDGVTGADALDKVIAIDQSPIGRTPRSNPATYTGLFGDIRELFAMMPEAKAKGYSAGRFSFNTKGGRCEACEGDGVKKIEMHFLPDVYVKCDVCRGKRYNMDPPEVT
ncbi:MAG: excinuclease ABC subunit UvrA, partial [Clostridia bacterium]|nr:excinuclease ABC subunit UvrA [Clostridia bacterium]